MPAPKYTYIYRGIDAKLCHFVEHITQERKIIELKTTQGLKDNRLGCALGWVSFLNLERSRPDDVINKRKIAKLHSQKANFLKPILWVKDAISAKIEDHINER